jgi:polyisoprenoid-binding protein YceI
MSSETARMQRWVVDRSGSMFELLIKHRSGPIRIAGTAGLVEADFEIDAAGAGAGRLAFTIDTARLGVTSSRDPRARGNRLLEVARGTLVRFESSKVRSIEPGVIGVSGRLEGGGRRLPLTMRLRARHQKTSLDVTATAVVDHRQLGLLWIPAGPLKAPTELVVRARLRRLTDSDEVRCRPQLRPRRPRNSRYGFMTGHPSFGA